MTYYPEFKLETNPFRYADRAIEKQNIEGGYEIVKTSAIDMVLQLAGMGTNTIVVGEKGCGKSTVIDSAYDRLPIGGVICVSGSEKFSELYGTLIRNVMGVDRENVTSSFFRSGKADVPPKKNMEGVMVRGDNWVCGDMRCQMRKRCVLMGVEHDKDKIIGSAFINSPSDINCPLRQWISIQLSAEFCRDKDNVVFLLDVPDKLVRKDADYFESFIMGLVKATGAQVILMATREQFRKIRPGSEYFMRWIAREFPPPSNEELKEILKSRVEGIFPFDRDALEYLVVECRGNPRRLIRRCAGVLTRMRDDGVEEPAGREYVQEVLDSTMGKDVISEMDAIVGMINGLYEDRGKVWVHGSEMVEILEDSYGIKINVFSLGWRLGPHGLGLEKKISPYAKYKVRRVSPID